MAAPEEEAGPAANPLQPAAAQAPGRARKPMYEDEHQSCSVLLAKVRNDAALLSLEPHDQFRWLHRFYLVVDRIAEQHRVYKLYGGPHGFMISTGVAEADPAHAATLLRFSLHLLQATQEIRLPGQQPLDLVMALASGHASSGLLGSTSLTYQIVGRCVAVARELVEGQQELPYMVTEGMHRALPLAVAGELKAVGSVPLRCCPGESEQLYSLDRFSTLAITQPGPGATLPPSSADMGGSEGSAGLSGSGASGSRAAATSEAPAPEHPAPVDGRPASDSADAVDGAAASPVETTPGAASEPTTPATPPSGIDSGMATPAAPPQLGINNHVVGEAPAAPAPPSAVPSRPAPVALRPAAPAAQAPTPSKAAGGGKGGKGGKGSCEAGSAADVGSWKAKGAVSRLRESSCGKLGSLPHNTRPTDGWLASCDLLLRFEDPQQEAAFANFNGRAQEVELLWLMLSLLATLLYATASVAWDSPVPTLSLLQYQAVPLLACAMWYWSRSLYLSWRETLWFVQRLVVLAATSLPSCAAFASPGATFFAFGLTNLALEAGLRRLRLHLQLLSSLAVYVATLTLMQQHPEGSPGRAIITPTFLSAHLLATCVLPVALTAVLDFRARRAFAAAHLPGPPPCCG